MNRLKRLSRPLRRRVALGLGLLSMAMLGPSPAASAGDADLRERLRSAFDLAADAVYLVVDVSRQELTLRQRDAIVARYPVSTSAVGVGNRSGSNRTPLGIHRVAARYGAGAPAGTIFVARQNTGRRAEIRIDPVDVPADHITSRILWLEGLEPGRNRGPGIDSRRRYIYIHGTHEEGLIGQPASHGCVRMRNTDVIELFDQVPEDTLVVIRR